MNIHLETIPHRSQRYETVGDWQIHGDGSIKISVSKMRNPDHEFLVGLHELVEVYLCQRAGVTQSQVDQFDMHFEAVRPEGNVDEPGDDSEAPYRRQHLIATGIEKLVAAELGVDWKKYDEEVSSL